MANCIHEHVGNINDDCPYCFDRLTKQIAIQKEVIDKFMRAASGLACGEDWNNGTHAKVHGYRQKLIDALAFAKEKLK